MDNQCIKELPLGMLEGHGVHLGLVIRMHREEVTAAALLAQGPEQAEQVGLGHSRYGQFVPGGKKSFSVAHSLQLLQIV